VLTRRCDYRRVYRPQFPPAANRPLTGVCPLMSIFKPPSHVWLPGATSKGVYGGELIDPDLARVWVYDIIDVVHDLESWGAEFIRRPDGELDLKAFPTHSRNRACHHYDTTGNMLTKVLSKKLRGDERIEKHSITAIVDLLKRNDRVVGAWGVDYHQYILQM
jgi:hypothetical protein